MPDEARLLAAFALALAATFAATPVAIAVATRTGFQDRPFGYKGHTRRRRPTSAARPWSVGFLLAALALRGDFARLAPIPLLACGRLGARHARRQLALPIGAAPARGGARRDDALGLRPGLGRLRLGHGQPAAHQRLGGRPGQRLQPDGQHGRRHRHGGLHHRASPPASWRCSQDDVALAALCLALCGRVPGLPAATTWPAPAPASSSGDGGSLPIGLRGGRPRSWRCRPRATAAWPTLLAAMILAGLPVVDTTLVMISAARERRPAAPRRARPPHPPASAAARDAAAGGARARRSSRPGWARSPSASCSWARGSCWLRGALWFVAVAFCGGPARDRDLGAGAGARSRQPSAVSRQRHGNGRPGRRARWSRAALVAFIAFACGAQPASSTASTTRRSGGPMIAPAAGGPVRAGRRPAGGAAARRARGDRRARGHLALVACVDPVGGVGRRGAHGRKSLALLHGAVRHARPAGAQRPAGAHRWSPRSRRRCSCWPLYLIAALLVGGPSDFFSGNRLAEPIGYVNGQAGYLLLGVWPLLAVAGPLAAPAARSGRDRGGRPARRPRGPHADPRGAVLAFGVTALVLVAALPDRLRRLWALVALAAGRAGDGAGAGRGVRLDRAPRRARPRHPEAGRGGHPPGGRRRRRRVVGRGRPRGAPGAGVGRGAEAAASPGSGRPGRCSACGALAAGLVAVGDPLERIEREVDSFVTLEGEPDPGAARSRLTSGSGNRYDYWRIALNEFESAPIAGLGAGNYERDYFEQRQDARGRDPAAQPRAPDPGGAGAGRAPRCCCCSLAPCSSGSGNGCARRRGAPAAPGPAGRGTGIFVSWLVHTSVDWLHVIPGITGVALAAAAVLTGPWARERAVWGRRHGLLVVAVCAVAVVARGRHGRPRGAGRPLPRPGRGGRGGRSTPGDSSAPRPRSSSTTRRSGTYYAKATAYARLDDYEGARAALLRGHRARAVATTCRGPCSGTWPTGAASSPAPATTTARPPPATRATRS